MRKWISKARSFSLSLSPDAHSIAKRRGNKQKKKRNSGGNSKFLWANHKFRHREYNRGNMLCELILSWQPPARRAKSIDCFIHFFFAAIISRAFRRWTQISRDIYCEEWRLYSHSFSCLLRKRVEAFQPSSNALPCFRTMSFLLCGTPNTHTHIQRTLIVEYGVFIHLSIPL